MTYYAYGGRADLISSAERRYTGHVKERNAFVRIVVTGDDCMGKKGSMINRMIDGSTIGTRQKTVSGDGAIVGQHIECH